MAYLTNPVYCGVGFVDAANRHMVLTNTAQFDAMFSSTYQKLIRMSPEQQKALAAQVQIALNKLPAAQAQQVKKMVVATQSNDPRKPAGLGDAFSTVASVAATIASLASVTMGVVNFVDARKSAKEQKEMQDRQEKAANKAMAEDIAARKAALAASKNQMAAMETNQELAAKGLMLDAEGNVVKKPTSPIATAGALAAAVTGAFLISK